jgi:ribose-phosphate pyrophosphokinase
VPHNEFVGIIAPDAGAAKRANEAATLYQLPVYQALKKRDAATGRLSNFTCETLPSEGKFLVVDDICDGGGTFIGLAKATGLPKERLALWVTHGIFSGKAADLKNFYSAIYTTNSHPGNIDVTYDHEFMKILTRHELKFNMIGNS